MRRRYFYISIMAVAVFGFLLPQDALARLAWQKYHWSESALALDRSDADMRGSEIATRLTMDTKRIKLQI